jgi:hypothetical protein
VVLVLSVVSLSVSSSCNGLYGLLFSEAGSSTGFVLFEYDFFDPTGSHVFCCSCFANSLLINSASSWLSSLMCGSCVCSVSVVSFSLVLSEESIGMRGVRLGTNVLAILVGVAEFYWTVDALFCFGSFVVGTLALVRLCLEYGLKIDLGFNRVLTSDVSIDDSDLLSYCSKSCVVDPLQKVDLV